MMLVESFFVFNMSDHIKYMRVGGQRHRARRGQLGGRTLTLGYITSLKVFFNIIWHAVMMLVDMRVFLFNMSDHIKYMRVGGR